MNKAWIAAAAAALALAGCGKETGPEESAQPAAPAVEAPVASATDDPAAARPLASFAGMDADSDGQVTSVEHAKASQAMFRMMDADRDGAVTVGEMDAAREAIGGTSALSSEKKIAALDGDNDGQLTLAEYVGGANAMFARMDSNQNEAIDRPEWDRGHAMINPAAGATPTPRETPEAG